MLRILTEFLQRSAVRANLPSQNYKQALMESTQAVLDANFNNQQVRNFLLHIIQTGFYSHIELLFQRAKSYSRVMNDYLDTEEVYLEGLVDQVHPATSDLQPNQPTGGNQSPQHWTKTSERVLQVCRHATPSRTSENTETIFVLQHGYCRAST